MLRVGETTFNRREHTRNVYPIPNWSNLKAHLQGTLYRVHKLYLGERGRKGEREGEGERRGRGRRKH